MKQKIIRSLEVIAPVTIGGGSHWALTTTDAIARVLGTAYLDQFATHNLRKGDRIAVTSDVDRDEPTTAWLLVLGNEKGHVRFKQLGAVQ